MAIATAALIIAGISALAGAAASNEAAKNNNTALGQSMEAARDAAEQQIKDLAVASVQQRRARLDETRRIEGRIRAQNATTGGDSSSARRQTVYDSARDLGAIRYNYGSGVDSIRAQLAQTYAQLQSQQQNRGFATLGGAAGGASTGLSLFGAFGGGR